MKANLPDSIAGENHELVVGVKCHCPHIGKCRDHLITITHQLVLLVDVVTWQFVNRKQLSVRNLPSLFHQICSARYILNNQRKAWGKV